MEKDRSVLLNNFFPSLEPQEIVICQFWRFIIYIGVYGVRVCDYLTWEYFMAENYFLAKIN